MKHYNTVLTIAGSDSIGGAGIQADIKTCCSLRAYAMTAITAITAQNTQGVRSYKAVDPRMLSAQLKAVCTDVRPDAVKIGMVPDADCAHIIANAIEMYHLRNIVVDPVMVATSGDALSDGSAISVMAEHVFPQSSVITPNLIEARALLGEVAADVPSDSWAVWLAEKYHCPAVLVKGGHGQAHQLTDVLYCQGQEFKYSHAKIDTPNTHGTGCSLSSAIACGLANGRLLPDAVSQAIDWLQRALEQGKDYELGHGHGPLYFFNS